MCRRLLWRGSALSAPLVRSLRARKFGPWRYFIHRFSLGPILESLAALDIENLLQAKKEFFLLVVLGQADQVVLSATCHQVQIKSCDRNPYALCGEMASNSGTRHQFHNCNMPKSIFSEYALYNDCKISVTTEHTCRWRNCKRRLTMN